MQPDTVNCRAYAIGLILYHPSERLKSRINLMIKQGYQVYVFDNSPEKSRQNTELIWNDSITYLTAGKNIGIGYSLSTVCATAYMHGFSYLLFLDQDTAITSQTLDFVQDYTASVIASAHKDYAAIVFNGNSSARHEIQDIALGISSGSLFNLQLISEINWHNEGYFVDCVDYEFCLRARRSGFKIGLVENTPDFDHVTEQPDQPIIVFGRRLLVRRYSAARIKDAITGYSKLLLDSLLHKQFSDSLLILRSLTIYMFGQVISRVTLPK